jgi:hypothetical protein
MVCILPTPHRIPVFMHIRNTLSFSVTEPEPARLCPSASCRGKPRYLAFTPAAARYQWLGLHLRHITHEIDFSVYKEDENFAAMHQSQSRNFRVVILKDGRLLSPSCLGINAALA